MTTLADIQEYPPHNLAYRADCKSPSTDEGRGFLTLTRDCLLERVTYYLADQDDDETPDWNDFRDDVVWEVADGVVPVYTYDVWATFTDLAAYNEGCADYVPVDATMEDRARAALYLIAERLCHALIGELEAADEDTTA